jgi:hypothetical protein
MNKASIIAAAVARSFFMTGLSLDRCGCLLVAAPLVWDLFLAARYLFDEARGRGRQKNSKIELDQRLERIYLVSISNAFR